MHGRAGWVSRKRLVSRAAEAAHAALSSSIPERRPLRAIPVPAGMDPEQRIKLGVQLAKQALARGSGWVGFSSRY